MAIEWIINNILVTIIDRRYIGYTIYCRLLQHKNLEAVLANTFICCSNKNPIQLLLAFDAGFIVVSIARFTAAVAFDTYMLYVFLNKSILM
jgi:hypothetical protein